MSTSKIGSQLWTDLSAVRNKEIHDQYLKIYVEALQGLKKNLCELK